MVMLRAYAETITLMQQVGIDVEAAKSHMAKFALSFFEEHATCSGVVHASDDLIEGIISARLPSFGS